jgi:hypothetical protein
MFYYDLHLEDFFFLIVVEVFGCLYPYVEIFFCINSVNMV